MLYSRPTGLEDVSTLLWCLARMKRVPDHQTTTWLVLELERHTPSFTAHQVGLLKATAG